MLADTLEHDAAPRQGQLEVVPCPLCRGSKFETVVQETFTVVKCPRCGLHFTNPRPDLASIGCFYPTDYRPHSGNGHQARSLRSWYPLDRLQPPDVAAGRPRLLDFGCGAGHFIAAMDRMGWEAAGLDVSETAVAAINEQLGLPAFAGSLPHPALDPASFELVTMWHSLEHVHDPLRVASEARRLLTPDGRLIVAVPNFGGWPRRYFDVAWFGLDLPRHLIHFDAKTLPALLEAAGFRVLEVRHTAHADWLRSSAIRAGAMKRRLFGAWLLRRRLPSRLAAWVLKKLRTSDAIMALAEPA